MDLLRRNLLFQVTAGGADIAPEKEIRINGNENPVGPGMTAFRSIAAELGEANRYPFNSHPGSLDLHAALANRFNINRDNIVIGAGSTEILRSAVKAFTGQNRHIVTANLTYGTPVTEAEKHGYPYRQVPLDDNFRLNLEGMRAEAKNAGLVYLCNPNNPTGTIHPASAIEGMIGDVRSIAPDCLILVDEAYHDYVTDSQHRSMISRAVRTPNLLVTRTFSKAYGMAGLRLGFGVGDANTIAALRRHQLPANANTMAIAAAIASLRDHAHLTKERQRNLVVRDFTRAFFTRNGFEMTESQGNFLFVNLRRPAREFRNACADRGVVVARDFPPFEKTHCRISLGTMSEMQRSCEVFAEVLGVQKMSDEA